jgi:hypothetical protein
MSEHRPCSVHIYIDISGSMSGAPLETVKACVKGVIKDILRDTDTVRASSPPLPSAHPPPPTHTQARSHHPSPFQISITAFDDRQEVVQPLAKKKDAMAAGLLAKVDAMHTRGGTALYDTIVASLEQTRASFQGYVKKVLDDAHARGVMPAKHTVEERAPHERVIFLTDGEDCGSGTSEEAVVAELQKDLGIPDLAMFWIGVGEAAAPGAALSRILSASGSTAAHVLPATNVADIAPAFEEMRRLLELSKSDLVKRAEEYLQRK